MPSAFAQMPSATDLASASRQRTLDCGGLKLEIKLALWEVTHYQSKNIRVAFIYQIVTNFLSEPYREGKYNSVNVTQYYCAVLTWAIPRQVLDLRYLLDV